MQDACRGHAHHGHALQDDLACHHEQRRRNALAGYVRNDHAQVVVVDEEVVVEVAAHLLGRGHAGINLKLRPIREGRENVGQHRRLDVRRQRQLRADSFLFRRDLHHLGHVFHGFVRNRREGLGQLLNLIAGLVGVLHLEFQVPFIELRNAPGHGVQGLYDPPAEYQRACEGQQHDDQQQHGAHGTGIACLFLIDSRGFGLDLLHAVLKQGGGLLCDLLVIRRYQRPARGRDRRGRQVVPAARQLSFRYGGAVSRKGLRNSFLQQRLPALGHDAGLAFLIHGKSLCLGPRHDPSVLVNQQVVFSFHGQALKRFLHVVQKQIGSHHRLQAAIRAIDRHGAFNAVRACVDILLIAVKAELAFRRRVPVPAALTGIIADGSVPFKPAGGGVSHRQMHAFRHANVQ